MANWVQFLVFALFLTAPAVSWVIQKLREQAEVKRVRTEAQRRREEELRTGRTSDAPGPSKLQSKGDDRMTELQRLAERRQQQLRELRARQERQQSTRTNVAIAPGSQAGGRQAGQRLPRGTGMRGQALPARRGSQEQVARQPAQQPRPSKPQPQQTPARQKAAQAVRQPVRDTVDIQTVLRQTASAGPEQIGQGQSIAEQLSAAPVTQESIARPDARGTVRRGVAGEVRSVLRGATMDGKKGPKLATLLAVTEILNKPVSMRDPSAENRV